MTLTLERESDIDFELLNQRPEITFGEQLIAPVDVDSLVDLSQIRDRDHARFQELKDSILNEGLDNAINVARVDVRRFAQYILFVNRTWGSNYRLRDFKDKRQIDGYFNLIVAGHNRAHAVQEIAAEMRTERGEDFKVNIQSKLMINPTVDQIIKKQYSENIHSSVVSEREAMFTVERFRWGLGKEWKSAEEFVAMQSSSKSIQRNLRDTLYFANLPKLIQEDVFQRRMPYKAGVELGKVAVVLYDLKRVERGAPYGPLTKEMHEEVDEIKALVLTGLAAHITNHPTMRKNAITAQMYIKSARQGYQKDIKRTIRAAMSGTLGEDVGFDELETPTLSMASPNEQARKLRRAAELDLARTLRKLSLNPHEESTQALLRYGEVIPDLKDAIIVDVTKSNDLLLDGLAPQKDKNETPLSLFEQDEPLQPQEQVALAG